MKQIDLWKSLEELKKSGQPVSKETEEGSRFPLESDFVSRREFMEWTSGVMAVLATSACTRQPEQTIIPYTKMPENVVPGKSLYYATTMTFAGSSLGLMVESHMGRPTKIDGNPLHPASLGATDAFAQAAILTLYDPDRSQTLENRGAVTSWPAFTSQLSEALKSQKASQGAGIRLLTETVASPTLISQIQELQSRYPKMKWVQYEPIHQDTCRDGLKMALGEAVLPRYNFEKAKIVVSFDGDFLSGRPETIRYTKEFAKSRTPGKDGTLSRLYAAESSPTLVGAMADERLSLRPSQIENLACAIANEFGIGVHSTLELNPRQKAWVKQVVGDLQANRSASLVVAGDYQSAFLHALVAAINEKLGNVGSTVTYYTALGGETGSYVQGLKELEEDMKSGSVQLAVILGANPVYASPSGPAFAEALKKVPFSVHCSLYKNETTKYCQWHVPEAHFLEAWSDGRAYDGTASICQPLIAPLYSGKSYHEVLNALLDMGSKSGYDTVRAYWQKNKGSSGFESFWRKAVHDGVVEGTAQPGRNLSVKGASWVSSRQNASSKTPEVLFRPDPTVWDGRFANNGWLQELPKPLSKLTWDNAAYVSPAFAKANNLATGDMVALVHHGREITVPVWIQPGQCEEAITVFLGYGRTAAGRVGNKTGFDVYPLLSTETPWRLEGVEVRKLGSKYDLACTQTHHGMHGRDMLRVATLSEFVKDPHFANAHAAHEEHYDGIKPPAATADYQWGMAINLGACTGCNACVIACQSENNIATVGKVEVIRGREMHWIRVDRYFEGDEDDQSTHFQPVPCMHCETAPCELVCPVGATAHDNEGLNNMVYNRCVGTKYCGNNCPYKVRRFNFYEYSDMETPQLKLMRNPNVTVRSRGVMEKCTYCVQRINEARVVAKNEGRKIRDGEVKTACQTACPADAIVFGDIADKNSAVSRAKADPLNYGFFEELNTKPRTTYLAKVKNPSSQET